MLSEPPRSRALDLAVGTVGLWFAAGLIFDSWAHLQIGVESFFTPYHAIFYSAMIGGAAAFALQAIRNGRSGFAISRRLPAPYRTALLGLPIFILGGVGDFIWHRIFSVEERIEAVTSPTHLLIGLGVVVLVSGPISSAVRNRGQLITLFDQLPLIFALATILEFIHLGTSYAFDPWAARMYAPPPAFAQSPDYFTATTIGLYKVGSGLIVVILQATIVGAFAVWVFARFRLAFGGYTLLFVLGESFLAAAISNDTRLFAIHTCMALAAGFAADVFCARFGRRDKRRTLRYFASCVTFAYVCTYFVLTIALQGTWWDWNLILGSICWAVLAGVALAMLAENVPEPAPKDGSELHAPGGGRAAAMADVTSRLPRPGLRRNLH